MVFATAGLRADDATDVSALAEVIRALTERGRAGATGDDADDQGPNYPIGSVGNALKLLLMFSDRKAVRIAEASREIGVARSTAHRLMQMLQHYDFVRQDPDSRAYVAGPALVEVGLSVVKELDIRTAARPWMERLVGEIQETVHLVELQGRNVIFLDSVESPRALRVSARTGMSLYAYAAASGKVLLAELSTAELRQRFPERKLVPITGRTMTSRRELEAELEEIRTRGYATNYGESEEEVSAVAVAIRDSRGIARGALSVSVPFSRLTEQNTLSYTEAAMTAAENIGSALP